MTKTILIKENRELELLGSPGSADDFIGVTGENNATVLHFEKPPSINNEDISEFYLRVVAVNDTGSYVFNFPTEKEVELSLGYDLTSCPELSLSVQFLKDNIVKWKSYAKKFYLAIGENDSGENESATARFTSELAASMAVNVGGGVDYPSMTFEQIVGTYIPPGEPVEGEDGVTIEDVGGVGTDYTDGVLYALADDLERICGILSPEITLPYVERAKPAYSSIATIRSYLSENKKQIIDIINSTLKPSTPYAYNLAWFRVIELVRELPGQVINIAAASADEASQDCRRELENKMSQLIESYQLELILIIGDWQADVEQLGALTAAVEEKTAELVADNFAFLIKE